MNSYTTNKTNKSFEKKLPFYYLGGVFVFLFAFVLYQQSPVFKAALLKDSSFAAEGASAEYKASNAYNQDGDPSTDPYDATTTLWFGNGQSTDKSYLGLYFTNVTLPPEQSITKAMLQVTSSGDSWISQSTTVFAEKSTTPQLFSKTAVPGQRALTASSVNYSDDVKWRSNKAYTFPDITSVVKEIAGQGSTQNVAIILKGTSGGSWGRKFIYGTSSDNAPKLIILSNMGSGGTNTNSPHPTTTPVVTTTPTARASATPTATKTPAPTSNPTPTMSPMPMPSTTPQQVGWSSQMGRWAPNPLWDTCTQAQHDAYNVVGPDGKTYPTWHPPIDPKTGCHFGHEHGADPRTSLADSSMPAFGYVGEQIGMVEPHAGFKVFVINKGDYTIEGAAPASWRSVIHMGTAGVKRYVEPMHSEEFDYITYDGSGRFLHTYGMTDTGNGTGSTCTNPRDGGRDFSTVGCNDSYEIWSKGFSIKHPKDPYDDVLHVRAHIGGAIAAFDPITTRDPADNTRLLFSHTYYGGSASIDPSSPQGDFQGCSREMYTQTYFDNKPGTKPEVSTVYYTDVFGTIKSTTPAVGLVKQEIATISNGNNALFKYRQDFCGNGIHAPN